MISLTAQQPFSLVLYKRRIATHPRLYLKDQPQYRYSRLFMTKIGFISLTFATLMVLVFVVSFGFMLQ